ncbi:hypothetical protein ET445_09670 [Agromyces protaetiae]|uniref:Uncharacterized protein n=1 Tax=Agromyces protaetiae TaxID=2509455 RepID=A0A4P6FHZ3_9MICO|nr:hypothetical protein [Agromyces protaetiae]QAY73567.1 hypothetical protein ET445_09670 [Agromyces protaetiae]
MSTQRTVRRLLTVLAGAAVTTTLLTGCFGNPIGDLVSGGAEKAIEDATGGDVSLGGDLPEGFPKDEVPLVDGEILFAAGNDAEGETGWLVTVKATGADPVADAVAKLEAAGYTEPTDVGVTVEGFAMRTNGTWNVLVTGDTDGLAYTITSVQ